MTLRKPLPADDLRSISSQTGPLWEEARGQRLLLTGGTGFFGCWLVESFCYINRVLALGAEITILTRDPEHSPRNARTLHPILRLPSTPETFATSSTQLGSLGM